MTPTREVLSPASILKISSNGCFLRDLGAEYKLATGKVLPCAPDPLIYVGGDGLIYCSSCNTSYYFRILHLLRFIGLLRRRRSCFYILRTVYIPGTLECDMAGNAFSSRVTPDGGKPVHKPENQCFYSIWTSASAISSRWFSYAHLTVVLGHLLFCFGLP